MTFALGLVSLAVAAAALVAYVACVAVLVVVEPLIGVPVVALNVYGIRSFRRTWRAS